MNTRLAKILTGKAIPDRFMITGDEPAWIYEWEWGSRRGGYDCGYIYRSEHASIPEAEKWCAEREEQERSECDLTRMEAAE